MSSPGAELLGRVVTSRAGRDRGDHYVIVRVLGEDLVLVADGQKRGMARPKKKNVKHLILHDVAPALAARLAAGETPRDEEIRAVVAAVPAAGGAEAAAPSGDGD